jgi:hemerythrin
MKLVEWNDSYSVGNVLMDAHHRIFFRMVRQFSKSRESNGHEAMKKRIAFLASYVDMHLRAEEKLLQEAGYPDFARHKAAHDTFAKTMHEAEVSFVSGQTSIAADSILQTMQDWLRDHILDEVKEHPIYFHQKT